MKWADVPDLKPEHAGKLAEAAIKPEIAARMGVRSATTRGEGIIFPYRGRNGELVNVFRPDDPGEDGAKYLWQSGADLHLSQIADHVDGPVVIVEGTKQALSVASWTGEDHEVYGMNGCWGWVNQDLSWTAGRTVLVMFDADLRTNRDVHDAAAQLSETLAAYGAEVRYVHVPGKSGEGIDDFLGRSADGVRTDIVNRLLQRGDAKLGRRPARKRPSGGYVEPEVGLRTDKLARDVLDKAPAALTLEGKIAMYENGVYGLDGAVFIAAVADLLGDDFRVSHRASVEEYAVGVLHADGVMLPEIANHQMVNVRNGMVDLATGQLKPHDPGYFSTVQLPIVWDEDAKAPRYETWLADVVSDQADDLEEVAATMLDPSRTPHKAAFLYGPSRSGKSTFLRLLKAIAGTRNTCAVTLQQLSVNRFAAANVYGKILNAAADLPSTHVDDLSTFKMLTGEDPIHADRKYGQQFMFTNRALFAFSANELPTVGESTRAYSERIKPFRFANSFAGREDQAVEDAIMAELSGILVRLVAAWQRWHRRGRYADTTPEVRHEFEVRSDRVRQWVAERCRVVAETSDGVAVSFGSLLPPDLVTSKRDLARAFNRWAQDQGAPPMGERKVNDRLTSLNRVFEVRRATDKTRGLNIVVGDDHCIWADEQVAGVAVSNHPTQDVCETGGDLGGKSHLWGGWFETATSATSATGAPLIFDLETAGAGHLHRYGPGFVRLAGYTTNGRIELTTDMAALVRRIESADLVTGHNLLAFDLQALARYHGLDLQALVARGAVFDTLLAARHLDPPMAREKGRDFERRYDLDGLGEKFELGGKNGDLKAMAKEFGGYDRIPVDDPRYRDYCVGDVELSAKVYDRLVVEVGDAPYLAREHRVAAIAAQISLNGFRVDCDLLTERITEGEDRKNESLSWLAERHGVPLTDAKSKPYTAPLATKAGKAALIEVFTRLGVTSYWTTGKTGDIATSYEAMRHLAHQHHHIPEVVEIAKRVARVVTTRTVYTTIQESLVGDRVHPTVTMKQSTGRWSITNPGLTVMGKRGGRHHEREVFIPDPGGVIIAVDLSQVDMRAVAGLSGDHAYIEMLRSEDPHAEIAKTLFGDVSRREEAKAIGHGWNYGRGIKAISNDNDLSPEIVRQFDRSMRERFPRLVEWQDEVREQAASEELLDNGFGRPMRPEPSRAHTQGPALMGQGGARDIMMEGLLRLPAEVLPMLRAQVHDEIVLSVPEADAEEIERVVVASLSCEEWRGVPIVAEAGSRRGRNWGEVYEK